LIIVFLVKEQKIINWGIYHSKLVSLPNFVSYIAYFLIPVLMTYLSLILAQFLDADSLEITGGKSKISEVEQANNAFLPSYLGYFFVALSVPYCETLYFVFGVLFLFTYFSQTLYFNPLFLVFGYQFFYLTTVNKSKIFIITKKSFKKPIDINLPNLRRINNFTFIDLEK
jgi:hypothetical protein